MSRLGRTPPHPHTHTNYIQWQTNKQMESERKKSKNLATEGGKNVNWYSGPQFNPVGNLEFAKRIYIPDFPGGPVVKNLPANTGDTVRSLVGADPTWRRATKHAVRHNYWGCTLEPTSHNYWALEPQLLKPVGLQPVLCNKRSHRSEKPAHRNKE